MSKTRAKSKSKATHQGLPVSHSHINSKKCLTHEGASNQPTYATDINIINVSVFSFMDETFLTINVTVWYS